MWYPGSGVVLGCIDFDRCRLSYFVEPTSSVLHQGTAEKIFENFTI